MPLYEYECRDCGHRFDRLATMAEADVAACPSCAAPQARRLLSVIAGLGGRSAPEAPACGQGACGNCS